MRFAAFVLLSLILVEPACSSEERESLGAAPDADTSIRLVPIATGLDSPVAITAARDGSKRLFVTLQRGRVVVFDGTRILSQPFLDIASLVSFGGERGLLSAAFHPRYSENGRFFVNYTDRGGDTVIAQYRVSASDPDRADPSSAAVILRIAQPFSNHNGGQLRFGPDGFLYVGMGDGGSGGDPANRAQNLGDLLGKILRIDVDGSAPYAIPPSNPFVGTAGARGEIWAYGLRNPWRFSFDRATGDLFVGDVGQGNWEEIDFQPASSGGGENYGWRFMEGSHCFNPPSGCPRAGLVVPIAEYSHAEGCSVSGGYRYRGARFPALGGMYFYGDYCSGTIWAAVENGGTWTSSVALRTSLSVVSFGEDELGELYVADLGGGIYRIEGTPERRRAVRR